MLSRSLVRSSREAHTGAATQNDLNERTKYVKEVIEGLDEPFLGLSLVADVEGNAEQPRPI